MDKAASKNILIVFLLTTTLFSIFKYATALKAVNQLKKEKQNLLQQIEKEKTLQQKLGQENMTLKAYLRASRSRITHLFEDYDRTGEKFSILKAENSILARQNELALQENRAYKAKLSSVTELKKAIKEIKRQMRSAMIEMEPEIKGAQEIREGNRGYLMKDGRPTKPATIRIEVVPASTKE